VLDGDQRPGDLLNDALLNNHETGNGIRFDDPSGLFPSRDRAVAWLGLKEQLESAFGKIPITRNNLREVLLAGYYIKMVIHDGPFWPARISLRAGRLFRFSVWQRPEFVDRHGSGRLPCSAKAITKLSLFVHLGWD
jgi:hypothetical protein